MVWMMRVRKGVQKFLQLYSWFDLTFFLYISSSIDWSYFHQTFLKHRSINLEHFEIEIMFFLYL